MRLPLLIFCVACRRPGAAPAEIPVPRDLVLSGARLLDLGSGLDGVGDLRIADGRIAEIGAAGALSGEATVDLIGKTLVPAWIDSHTHLAYLPEADALGAGGVAGAVDMAAPLSFLTASHAPLQVLASGPMVTATQGYPTQSWGRDGYGLECADADDARLAVQTLAAAGAGLIKLPITDPPVLDAEALSAAVTEAHSRGLLVASHALGDAEAALAAQVGVDVLAHTPTDALSEATVAAWSGRVVVSTLRAFGGSDTTVGNLQALRAAGATVVYGTDFGNTRTTGIDPDELALLQAAGLDAPAILAAGTTTPAEVWGLDTLGALAVGRAASLLVLDGDPREDLSALGAPARVYLDGALQGQ